MTNETKVYVGTYAKYNSGNLAGAWLSLSNYSDNEEFVDACKALHSDESDPEWMFQDIEGAASDAISESFIPEYVFEFEALDDSDKETVAAYASILGIGEANFQYALEHFEDNFQGTYNSPEEWGEQLLYDCYEVPQFLEGCIDVERFTENNLMDFTSGWHNGLFYIFTA